MTVSQGHEKPGNDEFQFTYRCSPLRLLCCVLLDTSNSARNTPKNHARCCGSGEQNLSAILSSSAFPAPACPSFCCSQRESTRCQQFPPSAHLHISPFSYLRLLNPSPPSSSWQLAYPKTAQPAVCSRTPASQVVRAREGNQAEHDCFS